MSCADQRWWGNYMKCPRLISLYDPSTQFLLQGRGDVWDREGPQNITAKWNNSEEQKNVEIGVGVEIIHKIIHEHLIIYNS